MTAAETEARECIRLICEWKGMAQSINVAPGTELGALNWVLGHTPGLPADLISRCQAAAAALRIERGE